MYYVLRAYSSFFLVQHAQLLYISMPVTTHHKSQTIELSESESLDMSHRLWWLGLIIRASSLEGQASDQRAPKRSNHHCMHSLKLDEAWIGIGWYHSIMESWIKSNHLVIKSSSMMIESMISMDLIRLGNDGSGGGC